MSDPLVQLAARPFPDPAISPDPQTASYGARNLKFLDRLDVALELDRLDGWESFVFHLTESAYAVLLARALLSYRTLLNGSKEQASIAVASQTLATFVGRFSLTSASSQASVMSAYTPDELRLLRDIGAEIVATECRVFDRDISFLDEVEDMIAVLDRHLE